MTEIITVVDPGADPDGHALIEIKVRRNARARRLTLRITPSGPVLTMPERLKLGEGQKFAERQVGWLVSKLEKAPQATAVDFGETVPFEGRSLQISPTAGRKISVDDDLLLVPQRGRRAGPAIAQWMKAIARDRLAERSDYFADLIGRRYTRLTLRDTRSRWGSCSAQGNLMYSWRLIMTPPEVLDYVAAHEVAHLEHMNHSDRFWGLVAEIFPDYQARRRWLRDHGAEIQRYQFTA